MLSRGKVAILNIVGRLRQKKAKGGHFAPLSFSEISLQTVLPTRECCFVLSPEISLFLRRLVKILPVASSGSWVLGEEGPFVGAPGHPGNHFSWGVFYLPLEGRLDHAKAIVFHPHYVDENGAQKTEAEILDSFLLRRYTFEYLAILAWGN